MTTPSSYVNGLPPGAPLVCVQKAVLAGQTDIALLGYSLSGNAVNLLSQAMAAHSANGVPLKDYIRFTGFMDAAIPLTIESWNRMDIDILTAWFSDYRLPIGTPYHVNYYQTNDPFIVGARTVGAGATIVNIWSGGHDHASIDDAFFDELVYGVDQSFFPHDGVIDRILR